MRWLFGKFILFSGIIILFSGVAQATTVPEGQADVKKEAKGFSKIAVFVNKNSSLKSMNKTQVRNFFLGRSRFSTASGRVITYDFDSDSQIRKAFYQSVTGKDISVIDAYLARLKYSGNVSLSLIESDWNSLLEAIKNDDKALAYGPMSWFDTDSSNEFRIIYVLDVVEL